MSIRLQLFGSPKVDFAGKSLVLPFERRSQLVALLALKRDWVGRAELAAMFWPDQSAKLAYANLRKILFRLQALPYATGIEVEGGAVRFVAATDVSEFEAALRDGRIADALPLRTGELLAGFDDGKSDAWTSWLDFERDRLRSLWRGVALTRLDAGIEPAEAIDLSARLLASDPLDEAALRAHMTWLARAGQSARARQAYQAFVGRLADDLGITPGAELVALHDTLGTARLPAPPTADPAAAPDGDFIGRSVELRRIAELLTQADCRLLSLVGPGGVGKTRLALRVLAQLAPTFPDGAVFVALEDVADADQVGARIAREIGVDLKRGADPEAQLIAFLRARRTLLVLDNFEHLTGAGPALERLLRACAGMRVVVTSRVRLGVALEHLLRIDGLPCPEPEDADHLEAFDAVRLFTQAARRVEPALVPAVEAAAIVDICRQVEGLPLALELAAAWTRVLSCAAIAEELAQGAQLLRTDDAAHPQRHASIEAVFDQSWRLLSPVERDALARLSVFRGGFTADAARAVARAPLPVLGALTDKSLVRKDGARMQLHPLVHQFAAARLGSGDARSATEAEHARWFHRLLAHVGRSVGNGDRETMRQVDVEFENCRTAWQWAAAAGAADLIRRSESALFNYCDHRLRNAEALALAREALASPASRADPKCEAQLLARAAHIEYRLDRYADAEATALRALPLLRAVRNRDSELLGLNVLGSSCLRSGRFEEARQYYRQGLQLAIAAGDPTHVAVAQDHVGLAEKSLGNYDEALRMSMQSLLTHRRNGDAAGEALCLNNLASLHLAKGEYAAASPYLREALAISERLGLDGPRLYVLTNLSEIAVMERDLAAAEDYARRALQLATAVGNRAIEASMTLQFAQLALLRGDPAAARRGVSEGLALAVAAGVRSLHFAGVILFAESIAAAGEVGCARSVIEFVIRQPDVSVPIRREAGERLARLPPGEDATPEWPGLQFDELVQRIAVEAELDHAPLIAALRGTR